MNRTFFPVAVVLGTSSLMLVDSAIKGAAILSLAALVTLMLRRDSAAIRHLTWLVAIVGMLVVPVFSAILPQWRALPAWAVISTEPVAVESPTPAVATSEQPQAALSPNAGPVKNELSTTIGDQPIAEVPVSPSAVVAAEVIPEPTEPRWNRVNVLPLLWAIGFCVLVLRLMVARLMLWSNERRGKVIALSQRPWNGRPAGESNAPIITAFQAACEQLGVRQPVRLLIHSERTIPVVWGITRFRLLLPAAAREWSVEQLNSVLLHELAHIKRRDTIAQLLVQIACALHWFNPLAWFAAWRLRVERERACDDLVLARGVRASAYAEHLLNVATRLSPSRWTQACGIAMARNSSLEGRLRAVLSEKLNRRGVSVALGAIALAIGVGIAVPIAMLRAADEKPGAPVQQQGSQKRKDGAKLPPDTEGRLKWGESVNGLRAALVIRHATGEPTAGDIPDLYLVVQNVSNASLRLTDSTAAPQTRVLYVKRYGKTMMGLRAGEPKLGDLTLQPREVAFVFMLSPDATSSDGRTMGSILAEGALKDTHQTMVAHMQVDQAPAGAWTGKLVTGETSAAVAAGQPQPKDESAQSLFKKWQDSARINGKIPGGALGSLAAAASNFIKHNPTDERAPKLAKLLKRIDISRDWTQADAVTLLDDVTAVYSSLPEWAEDLTRFSIAEIIRTGQPLPAELEDAPWGEAQPNGLRAAWLLDPRAEQHRLGTPLKSRILFHNAGKNAVVFRALTWNQSGRHMARDAKGTVVKISSTDWTTIPQIFACRLAPGEYTEVIGAGIGVGADKDHEDWRGTRVGAWIEAKEGDEVTFTPAPVSADGRDGRAGVPGESWWLAFITARLNRDAPLPDDASERERLLDRAMRNLFGTAPTPEETATFVADRTPDAMDALAKRLARRAGTTPYTGTLQSGETKFRVLPVDPDAAKKPRVATGPGRYTLGDHVRLVIVRKPDGDRRMNEADIRFFSSDPKNEPPGKPHEIKLPDGYHTWAIAWERGSTVLWVAERGVLHSYDFTNPADVKETRIEPADITNVPEPLREALRPALEGSSNASPQPAAAEALP